jgi:hypothetical protein
MRQKIHVIFSFVFTALLSGCSMANLSYADERLAINVEAMHLSVNGISLGHHTEHFQNMTLLQESLRLDEGNIVVYEEAQTDVTYEFNLATANSVEAIFDAQKVTTLYSGSEFYLFQVYLKDASVLNVAAEQHDDQRLALVYGLTTLQLKKIIDALGATARETPLQNARLLTEESNILLSKWTMQTIYFRPLIVPFRYLYGH